MPTRKLERFLDENHVKYVTLSHSQAFTAQEIAAAAHLPGREVAKTVMVELDGELAMAVVPAPRQVDLEAVRELADADRADLADESEFETAFPECESGAMPPFGNLWGMQVYVDEALTRDEQISFNGGSHTELVQIPYEEFERLVHPRVGGITAAD